MESRLRLTGPVAGAGAVVLACLVGVWGGPILFAVPLLATLLTAAALWIVRRARDLSLAMLPVSLLILGFPLIAAKAAGLQIGEVLYGAYLVGYIGLWFLLRFAVYGERILHTLADWAVFLFLVFGTLSAVVARLVAAPGTFSTAFGDWSSLIVLASYFPIREAVQRNKHGVKYVLTLGLIVCGFLLLRNLLQFRELALQATQVWQVARGRIPSTEIFMLMPALGCLMAAALVGTMRSRLSWGIAGILFLGGLILTQSRGYWVDYGLGVALLLMLLPARSRLRLIGYGSAVVVVVAGAGTLLIGPIFELVVAGALERVLSIFTSTEQDLSLINRFYEAQAVLDEIWKSPLLGWGLGAQIRINDLIMGGTHDRVFFHNGYVGLWYKTGLWGIALMGSFWIMSALHGLQLYRAYGTTVVGQAGLFVLIAFISVLPSVSTSSPFFVEDQLFMMGFLGGMVAGLHARYGPQVASSLDDQTRARVPPAL